MDQEAESRHIREIAEPGIKADPGLARELRAEVARLLGRTATGFPGAQPVSFSRRHIEELKTQDYYVCEKSDGIRYLLYCTEDEAGQECHYLIDRKNNYWFIEHRNLHFPLPDQDPASFHTGTLIDGELVLDDVGGGKKEPRFLVFDLLALDGKADVLSRPLDKRLGRFKNFVMEPYKKLLSDYPEEVSQMAFLVEMKDMQVGYGVEMMFRDVLPNLKHGNDGLIFTCKQTAYQCGTDQHILKWKPPHDNTIDFRMRLEFPTVEPTEEEHAEGITEPFVDYDSVPRATLHVFHGQESGKARYGKFSEPLYLSEEDWEQLKAWNDPLQDRVVECGLDNMKRWRLFRFRDDKQEANHKSTVASVLDSIKDCVDEADLMAAAGSIKEKWKLRQKQQR